MEEQVYIQGSYQTWKSFKEGTIWKDMDKEFEIWENRILAELANPTFDTNTGQMHLGKAERVLYDEYLRGCLKAIQDVRTLPEIILTNLEADEDK